MGSDRGRMPDDGSSEPVEIKLPGFGLPLDSTMRGDSKCQLFKNALDGISKYVAVLASINQVKTLHTLNHVAFAGCL